MSSSLDPLKTCLHLRSKQMLYEIADDEAEAHKRACERAYGSYDATAYWCDCTATGRGPDDQPVNRDECDKRRKCFTSIESLT